MTVWPTNSLPKRQSMHSSSNRFTSVHKERDLIFDFLKKRDDLFSLDGRKTFEEIVDGFPPFDIINQRLNRHTSPGKDRRSAHHIRKRIDDLVLHGTEYGKIAAEIKISKRY